MVSPDSDDSQPVTEHASLGEGGLYTVHEQLGLEEIFTRRETRLVKALRDYGLAEANPFSTDVRKALQLGFRGLGALAAAMQSYPSLYGSDRLGPKERSAETLMRTLLLAGENGLEWTLPTKALLSRTFGIAKVNFWSSLQYAVQDAGTDEAARLLKEIREAIEEAVYTRLAEELYASFVTSRTMDKEVKQLAIGQLLELWEGRAGFATYRFCPVLRSAWVARCRAPRVFGTLMGVSEIASLLFQDCDARFIEFFTRSDDAVDRVQAFQEFVFDLPFESLEQVRSLMQEEGRDVVGPDEVARYLGFPKGKLNPLIEDPKALYSSFRTRRVKAQYRTSMRVAGPKRTAESYVLEGLLRADRARTSDGEDGV
jgi:hypothetical protein